MFSVFDFGIRHAVCSPSLRTADYSAHTLAAVRTHLYVVVEATTAAMAGKIIYHLVQEDLWKKADGEGYLPPTYEADGFIHATEDAPHLIPVANYFYTGQSGVRI